MVAGYAGAAAVLAPGRCPPCPSPPTSVPDDGLTRYVLTAATGDAADACSPPSRPPTASSTRSGCSDGRALVATDGPRPAPPRGRSRASPTPSSRRPCPCSAPSPTRTSRSTATTWTTPGATPTASPPSPTPTSTPPRAGTAARATARSSPSSTPATTPTTPSSPARCGPTRPSPAARPTPTATARPATATAGTSRPTAADVDNGSYGTHGASVSGVVGGAGGQRAGHRRRRPRRHDHAAGHRQRVVGRHGPGRRGHPLRRRPRRRRHQRLLGRPGERLGPGQPARRPSPTPPPTTCSSSPRRATTRPTGTPRRCTRPASTEPNVVTVGNSTAADRDQLAARRTAPPRWTSSRPATWSSRPGTTAPTGWCPARRSPSPQVAAAYALYRAAWPDGDRRAELRQALLDDVDPVPAFAGQVGDRWAAVHRLPGRGRPRRRALHVHVDDGARRRRRRPASPPTGEDVTGDYAVTVGLGMEHERRDLGGRRQGAVRSAAPR